MSTDAPLPSAPELPMHDEVAAATSSWAYRHSAGGNEDGINVKAEMIQPTAPEIEEKIGIDTDKMANTSQTSATAYSFSGSALNSETNKKESNAETKSNNESSTNGTNNNTNNTNDNSNSSNSNSKINDEDKNDDSMYECNICLDTAKDAVVSMCGHLFCWPCLHQWLETRPNRKLCPVCKAAIGKDKVIPLYGRNSTKQEDPRNKVPPRPAGQRTEPEPQQGFQGFGFGDGFHMSFGIGAFPFGYFASSFNFGEPRPAAANRGNSQYEDEQQLSKMFLYLAFLCIAWLLFA